MTAENGIRTENKMKRLAAAIGVALAAVLAAASLSPARADAAGTSDGNLVIDVPTTVPCALMADGTVVSPSEWKITTSGDAYIAFASASGFPANVEWSAKTTDLAAAQAGSVRVSGTGDAASVAGPSDPAAAALAGTARFEWSFSKLDAGKNADVIGKAASGTAVLGSVAFTFAKVQTAFAVYSADDNSLTFYKRADVPIVGQMFEGKTATEVYEGVEKASYTAADGAPWSGHAADIASVTVADAGVAPVSTAYWFKGASKLGSVSLAGLDTSQTTSMDGMFDGCSSLESLDLSAMSTRRVTSMTAFLGGCDSLAELSLGSEFAWIGNDCYPPTGDWKQGSTGTKYAENQIPANKTDKYTRTKTAFAVYSADDQSLTFYKRPVAPAEGAQFLGKTASKVFTGFETGTYSPSSVPWAAYRSNVKAVTVADDGIAPTSTAYWFYFFTNATSIDLSKLDTGKVASMRSMFDGCTALTGFDLSSFDTNNVTDMNSLFYGCESLTTLDLSSFDTGNVTDMRSLFQDCNALTVLDLSSFDTGNVTNMACIFSECPSLEKISLGTGFKWVGWNCYPRSGNWESSSTGKVYSAREIPSGVADTYVFKPNTKASTAVNAASDPANNDATIAAMTSTGNTQGESAIQEATEGKPTLEEKTSKECDASSELDGVEKDAEAKPAVENEATKEDVTTTEPEGAEKATAVKSRE